MCAGCNSKDKAEKNSKATLDTRNGSGPSTICQSCGTLIKKGNPEVPPRKGCCRVCKRAKLC